MSKDLDKDIDVEDVLQDKMNSMFKTKVFGKKTFGDILKTLYDNIMDDRTLASTSGSVEDLQESNNQLIKFVSMTKDMLVKASEEKGVKDTYGEFGNISVEERRFIESASKGINSVDVTELVKNSPRLKQIIDRFDGEIIGAKKLKK